MTIVGIGADICDIGSIRKTRFPRRVGGFFLTEREMRKMPSTLDRIRQFVASRCAAKEAVIKAFPFRLTPLDFEIRMKRTKPTVYFLNSSYRRTYRALVSISHTQRYTLGYAITLSHLS